MHALRHEFVTFNFREVGRKKQSVYYFASSVAFEKQTLIHKEDKNNAEGNFDKPMR